VVDAGHGGHDPGAIHHGVREKDLTLDIARRLTAELQGRGLAVTMTRDRDEFLVLSRRPNVANRIQADCFVSVHVNANRSRQVSGVEVYYPRESVVDAAAPFPPHIEPAEVWLPTATIKQILWDLVLTRTRRQSVRMAVHICRAMRSRLHVRCRGVRGARFVVLREARMPAVLVEVGYLSNQREAARLAQTSYRQAIAQAIAEGLTAYVRELGLEHI
jgi:N-acetylmuramoyl-L-alanine amidase